MKAQEFVDVLKVVVIEATLEDIPRILENPPGRKPTEEIVNLSKFYIGLNDTQREFVCKIIHMAADMSLFGFLCVLDGVRAIEDPEENDEEKGKLELYYVKEEISFLLNNQNSSDEFLHDLL